MTNSLITVKWKHKETPDLIYFQKFKSYTKLYAFTSVLVQDKQVYDIWLNNQKVVIH